MPQPDLFRVTHRWKYRKLVWHWNGPRIILIRGEVITWVFEAVNFLESIPEEAQPAPQGPPKRRRGFKGLYDKLVGATKSLRKK